MICSMTGFARSQDKGDWGAAIWELRSVNHRYLDSVIRLPEVLRELEPAVREIIQNSFARGKIECSLRFQPGATLGGQLTINQNILGQLIHVAKEAHNVLPEGQINITEMLCWPNLVTETTVNVNFVQDILLALLKKAILALTDMRQREGKALFSLISDRLTGITKQVSQIKKRLPFLIPEQREKILTRLEDVKAQLDLQRLEQEMVYLAQKIDVSEELDRIESHIEEVKRTLSDGDAVGRRLDFMMQELNREANTLAAKSTDSEVTYGAVEMKVLIEQMREQVQNIE